MAVDQVNRVGPIGSTTATNTDAQQATLRRFAYSADSIYDGNSTTDLSGIVTHVGPAEQSIIQHFYSSYDSDTQARLHELSYGWTRSMLSQPYPGDDAFHDAACAQLDKFLTGVGGENRREAAQAFVAEALGAAEAYMFEFGERVENLTKLSNDLREDRKVIQEQLTDWPEGEETQNFSWTEVSFDADGNPVTTEHTNEPLTKEQAENLLDELDKTSESVAQTSDIAKFDLQTKTEEYQRMVQIITSINEEFNTGCKTISSNMK